MEAEAKIDPLVGCTLLERYRLTRKIGEGGMGTVYEATHVLIGKSVAVKILREKYADRPEVAKRLVQEARLASSIRHDHIIDITDSGTTSDGRTFVVMELLDGRSLAQLIAQEGALPEVRAIDITRQVAGALEAAHKSGIVHRDVKPENIFICQREGRDFVKVVDFGISKSLLSPNETSDADLRLTHTGMVLGTPLYMSPEQARGDEDLDHRIDIYALGVILYECVTGEVPFSGSNYLGIISQVLNQAPTAPRALRPELRISETTERVVLRAMAKPRQDRYPTMALLAADLERALLGEPVEAPAPTPTPSRWSRLPLFAGAGLVAVAAALFLALRSETPPRALVAASASPAPPPAAAKTVKLQVTSRPTGAEVQQGDRFFGRTPCEVVLPRDDAPVRLSLRLDGYEPAHTEIVPTRDDIVQITLRQQPKDRHPTRPRPTSPPPTRKTAETLPNPY